MIASTFSAQSAVEVGVVLLLLIGIAFWLVQQARRKQTLRLQRRFDGEYGRTIARLGRAKGEQDLKARELRVQGLKIVPLASADAERFIHSWAALQSRFIDNPKGVVLQADQLVRDVMLKRGYPMAEFAVRAQDISVDHPTVVENYRLAQAIATRAGRDEADTEDLRKGVVHYRSLFDELLEVWVEEPAKLAAIEHDGHDDEVPAHS